MVTFRRRKKDDGSSVTYPVNVRTRATIHDYVNKYSGYWEFGGKDNALNAVLQLQDAISKENSDVPFMLGHLEILHGALLAGVNMEGFHDIILDNPSFEAALLKSISAGNGESISDLLVFDGSKISGIVNTISVNPDSLKGILDNDKGKDQKASISNLSRLARLQFLPISKDIFISLSSRGGFYYRQGNILVPFNRLTMDGIVKESAKLTNPEFINQAIARIQEFNKAIASQAEGKARLPGYENPNSGAGIDSNGATKNVLFTRAGKDAADFDIHDLVRERVLDGDKPKTTPPDRDKTFYNFRKIFGVSGDTLDNPDYRTAWARLEKDVGYSQYDKNGKIISPNDLNSRIMGDIYLYGYSHGIPPDQIIEDMNDTRLDERQAALVTNFRNFTKTNINQKDKVLETMISAFKKANKLKDIPSDPTDFDELRSGDSALSSTVRSLWNQWVSPENFDSVSAQYQKYAEEEGISTDSFR